MMPLPRPCEQQGLCLCDILSGWQVHKGDDLSQHFHPSPHLSPAWENFMSCSTRFSTLFFTPTHPFSYSNKSNIIVIILLEHFQMALDTIQILGGNGYLNDYPAGWDEHKMNYFSSWNAVLFQGDFYVTQRFMRLGLELKRWKTQFERSHNSQQL